MRIKGLERRGDYYYYQPPQVDGIRPKRIALGTTDLSEALTAIQNLSQTVRPIERLRLKGEVQRYLEAKDYTFRSRQGTLYTLRRFETWAGNITVTEITKLKLERWQQHLRDEHCSKETVVTYMRRLQGFCTWLHEAGKIPIHPFNKLKVERRKRSRGVTFCTKEQREKLINTCDRSDIKFVLMSGFFLGLRKTEIIEAVPYWFRTPGLVEVSETATFQPKDQESRVIHYGKRYTDFLKSYDYDSNQPFMVRPDVTRGRSYYRWDFRKPFERLVAKCDLPWVTAHVMRHTFATMHVMNGTPISIVADWLGDDVKTTSDHYVAYAPTDAHIGNLD